MNDETAHTQDQGRLYLVYFQCFIYQETEAQRCNVTCPLSTYSFLPSIVGTFCETVSAMTWFSHGSISPLLLFIYLFFFATIVIERLYWSTRVLLWTEQLANLENRQVLLKCSTCHFFGCSPFYNCLSSFRRWCLIFQPKNSVLLNDYLFSVG